MSSIDLDRLIRTLEPGLRVGLETAASLAARHQHPAVDIAHWLRSLLDQAEFVAVFEELRIPTEALRNELDLTIAEISRREDASLALSPNVLALAREAWLVASLQFGRNTIYLADLLAALTIDHGLRIAGRGIAPSLRGLDRAALDQLLERTKTDSQPLKEPALNASAPSVEANEFLRLYTRDMTADAQGGRIDPVIGRDREMRQLVDILLRRRQNNPLLVGEAGVGKTAVAEALALEIAAGDVPDILKDVKLLLLDLSLLQAGAGVKGEFERRLHGVVDAVKTSTRPIILFIDEAHGLIGAGGQAGQGDAANILKPALARGELRTIAATTWSEYKRFIEKDAALTRRFQTVHVREPDEATAIRMLRGVASSLKSHHHVRIRDDAIVSAVKLSARYLPERQLPDKAISLLDTAAAAVALARQTVPEALASLKNEQALLKTEVHWLKDEPETDHTKDRLLEIDRSLEEISRDIETLEAKYDDEMRLAHEADRLEDAFAEDASIRPLASTGNLHDDSNVAAFRPHPANEDSARNALAATERTLATVAGETPLVPRVVDREVVASILARWTGVPVGKLLSDQVEGVKTLEEKLKGRVLGQDAALGRVAAAMKASRAGLSDPRRPPAVFLLVGMSGTGKTETALSLADLFYGGTRHLTTINMSEFKEEHKISMLLGSPPGYVGYGEGGVLTEAVRRRPYGVLLLDEIDKAHTGVQEIFYQVFDKGVLRDGEGRDVDFKNTTIFMTANSGSELLNALAADPDTMPEGEALEALLLPELQKQFKPAFLGRTTILPFMPLGAETLSGIVDIQLEKIAQRVRDTYGTKLSLSKDARSALISRSRASEMGARTIEVVISRDLLPLLSTFFLDSITAGSRISELTITYDGKQFGLVSEDAATAEFAERQKRQSSADEEASSRKRARGGAGRKANTP